MVPFSLYCSAALEARLAQLTARVAELQAQLKAAGVTDKTAATEVRTSQAMCHHSHPFAPSYLATPHEPPRRSPPMREHRTAGVRAGRTCVPPLDAPSRTVRHGDTAGRLAVRQERGAAGAAG